MYGLKGGASLELTSALVCRCADAEDGEDDGGAGDRPEREVRVGQDHGSWRAAAASIRPWVRPQTVSFFEPVEWRGAPMALYPLLCPLG